MKSLIELRKRTILIVGLGRSGMSVVHFLSKNKIEFSVVENRESCVGIDEVRKNYPNVKIHVGFCQALFERFDVLIISPGISLRDPAIEAADQKGALLIGDIEIFSWVVNKPVIAVTGTNGKSSVVAMLGEIGNYSGRNIQVCGNFGDPVLEFVENEKVDVFVVELSSFQLETTYNLRSVAACILNISEDHMDRYADMHEYIDVKHRIYSQTDCFVVNRNDKNTWPRIHFKKSKIIYFSEDEPLQKNVFGLLRKQKRILLMLGNQVIMQADDLKVIGVHNAANALVAIALAREVNLPIDVSRQALQGFTGLRHRVEYVCEKMGVRWFNDSKGTNVGATVNAVKGMAAPVVLIAGGEGKGADFSPLIKVAKKCMKAAVLIGRDASEVAESLSKANVPVMYASTMNEAVNAAKDLAVKGDIVLLSPACASFDMFKNFEERGEIFIKEVMKAVA